MSRAQAGGWHAAASWLSLTGAAALLAAFAGWQHRAAAPLLPLRVLADRDRAASIIALTLASAGIYSVFLFLTYYLQTVQAYTPVRTGLAFLPMVATTITGAVLGANVLLTRIGPRLTLPLGMLASAAGMAWLTRLTVTSSYPGAVLGPLLILGLGLGLIFAPAISLGTARFAARTPASDPRWSTPPSKQAAPSASPSSAPWPPAPPPATCAPTPPSPRPSCSTPPSTATPSPTGPPPPSSPPARCSPPCSTAPAAPTSPTSPTSPAPCPPDDRDPATTDATRDRDDHTHALPGRSHPAPAGHRS